VQFPYTWLDDLSDFGEETMKEEWKIKNPLVALLLAKMGEEGLSVSALAGRLGISQGYMSQLLREDKLVATASEEFIRQCATYLNLPAVSCFLLAGRLIGADFYKPATSFEQQLKVALAVVAKSPEAQDAAVSYDLMLGLPLAMQHLLVLMHERVYDDELIPGRLTSEALQFASQSYVPFSVSKVKFK
jgi:transcriptional regulator with XRE-family HTH domain